MTNNFPFVETNPISCENVTLEAILIIRRITMMLYFVPLACGEE
jgi:hypothetical protein